MASKHAFRWLKGLFHRTMNVVQQRHETIRNVEFVGAVASVLASGKHYSSLGGLARDGLAAARAPPPGSRHRIMEMHLPPVLIPFSIISQQNFPAISMIMRGQEIFPFFSRPGVPLSIERRPRLPILSPTAAPSPRLSSDLPIVSARYNCSAAVLVPRAFSAAMKFLRREEITEDRRARESVSILHSPRGYP